MTRRHRSNTPEFTRSRRREKLLPKAVIGVGIAAIGLVGLDSAAEYYLSYRQTGVHQIDNTVENIASPDYDENTATIFINGLGRDISDDQARAMLPVVGNFGRVYYFEYLTSDDTSAMASKIYETIVDPSPSDQKKHINIVASSMGDRFGYEIARELNKIEPNIVELLIMNTGPGPLGRERVKPDAFRAAISQSRPEIVPGNIAMAIIELFNQMGQGREYDSINKVGQTAIEAFEMNGRVIAMQMCELNNMISLRPKTNPIAKNIAYLKPNDPSSDQIVDTVAAADDWKQIFPNIEIISINGVGHDHISYKPELFGPTFETLFTQQRLEREMMEYAPKNPRIK